MSLPKWAAAPLAGAVITLAAPTPADAAPVLAHPPHPASRVTVHGSGPAVHGSGPGAAAAARRRDRRVRFDGAYHHHFGCPTRAPLVFKNVRAILKNCRRGPEAIIKSTKDGSVLTFLDVNIPFNTSGSYQFRIVGFFRRHPALLVQNFDRRPRWFYFPPSLWHYRGVGPRAPWRRRATANRSHGRIPSVPATRLAGWGDELYGDPGPHRGSAAVR